MKNLEAVAKEAGTDLANAVKTTCFLADMGDFAAFNEIYAKYFVKQACTFLCGCKNTSEECSLRSGNDRSC